MNKEKECREALESICTHLPFGVEGTYWVCIDNHGWCEFTVGKLYRSVRPLDEICALINDRGRADGWVNCNLECFRKATYEEIVSHFNIGTIFYIKKPNLKFNLTK